jgi:hypothetical protein
MMVLKNYEFCCTIQRGVEDNCFLMLILWISAVWKGTTVILSMMQEAKYKDDDGSFPKLNQKLILFRK